MTAPLKPFLILASQSPRRGQLLREAGFSFRQTPPPYDDTGDSLPHLSPADETIELACRKARSVAGSFKEGLILGADTLVFCDGKRLGKPRDRAEAQHMLEQLMGRRHQVYTGICLIDAATGRSHSAWRRAEVLIHPVDAGILTDYLDRGYWAGKAGGYNLAEMTPPWRVDVSGEADCVVGLPLSAVREGLRQFGFAPPEVS